MKIFKSFLITLLLITTILANEQYIIGYYPYYRTGTYPPSQIPLDKITHIIHSFVWPNATGEIITPNNFFEVTPTLVSYAHDNGAKVILSIGGGGNSEYFDEALADTTSRKNFISNLVDICIEYEYDGIDIDWEQPQSIQDKKNLNSFVIEMEAEFEEWLIEPHISIAVPASDWRGKYYDASTLKNYINWFGVMTYDFYGSWSSKSGFNSSLFKDPSDPQYLSVDSSIREYWHGTKNIPYNKLVSGIPFYGYKFNGASGPYKSFTSATSMTYSEIATSTGYNNFWNAGAKVPWLENGSSFISFDDTLSVKHKCQYAKDKNLAGVMIWELSQSYFSIDDQPLLETVINEMTTNTKINIANNHIIPEKFQLHQNYPNPFNPSTTINFDLPQNAMVNLTIYDIKGNLVKTLVNEQLTTGFHTYSWQPENISTGVYFYKIEAVNENYQQVQIQKCLFIK